MQLGQCYTSHNLCEWCMDYFAVVVVVVVVVVFSFSFADVYSFGPLVG